ncbi:MAG: methylcrotonoyl-CoA carboxylase, partial [Caulobacteraceae bacterium]|nr:methylcrotonoyl-CoA carboxylase [Caulobacteraceae bacterium]
HIEVQVFGDSHGEVVHLFERDCSLQRRHQKVIEEAPAPGMDEATRAAVTAAAVKAAKAVNYVGAGTIEFIADGTEGLRADRIWFMEMNTRLQVEHPVTEAITGVDLVEWQFRAAAGEPVPLKQDELSINGWAMEARLYAEDPANGFLPSIGKLEHFVLPEGVRIDTGVEEGGEVSQFYDPMIAKLIVRAETRQEAAEGLAEAASQVQVWPVKTNAAFIVKCVEHPRFMAGDVDTGFIAAEEGDLIAEPLSDMGVEDAAHALRHFAVEGAEEASGSPWDSLSGAVGFRANATPRATQAVVVDGQPRDARLLDEDDHPMTPLLGLSATRVIAFEDGSAFDVTAFARSGAGGGGPASDGALRAPMPGKIVATPAKAGDVVTKGQPVIVLEAMKMEHALNAPFDGVVGAVAFAVGDQVAADAVLAVVEAGV